MKSILERPRTVTVRGTAMRFTDFTDFEAFAELKVQMLKDQEARLGYAPPAPDEWTSLAERAEGLADLCAAQEQWLAEHDAELAAEADTIRAMIRRLGAVEPIIASGDGP